MAAGFTMQYLSWGLCFHSTIWRCKVFRRWCWPACALLAGALFAVLAVARAGGARLGWHSARLALIGGVLMLAICRGAMVYGVQHLPSGLAALVCASLPLWTVILQTVLPASAGPTRWRCLADLGWAWWRPCWAVAWTCWRARASGVAVAVLALAAGLGDAAALFRPRGRGYGSGGAWCQMLLAGVVLLAAAAICGQWRAFCLA